MKLLFNSLQIKSWLREKIIFYTSIRSRLHKLQYTLRFSDFWDEYSAAKFLLPDFMTSGISKVGKLHFPKHAGNES